MPRSDGHVAVILSLAGAIAYLAFGWGAETVYDYFGRLAEALTQGRWWLTDDPPWLNELVSCGAGRWCVVSPPLPAVLTIPFLPLGTALAQSVMSRIAGGASAGLLYMGLRAYGASRWVALTGSIVSVFGTTLLFSSVDGRSWYAAHSVGVLFACAAFWIAARGGSSWVIGALIGLAALARLPIAAAAPALALLAARRTGMPYPRVLAGVIAGGAPSALLYVAYDLARWGSVFDLGYVTLTEGDVFFSHGLFSPLYVPRHLYAIFLAPPELVERVPYFLRPRFEGMSLFLTTPALLWVFAGLRAVRRDSGVAAAALAAGCALLPNVLWGSVGQPQFGYRASLDAQPFLAALAVTGDAQSGHVWRRRPSILFIVAGIIAVAINVYAAIGIVRFGYWQ